ncbi:hypothetical protein LTR56_024147 [Elasticomyces elasticus]|nr:hypothetical protein LTR56_024147 [Elasticomyces elasticus]KAK3628196.1 hypothetical protein LTR22_022454 [Elasticomyces elasticus]
MPIPNSDRYSRYKAGTTKIRRWLKTAANSRSDFGKSLAVLCIADDAAATARDLIHLATVIATSTKSRAQIPLEILVVVKDGHWRRQACAEWYADTDSSHVDGEAEKANQRHRKFIKVLKQYDLCGFLGNAWQEYKDGTPSFETDIPSAQQTMFSGRLLGASGYSPYIRHMTDESKKNKAYTRGDSP